MANLDWAYNVRISGGTKWSLEYVMDVTDFEPVYFGDYTDGEGWSYIVVPLKFACYMRHRVTGKMYAARKNQIKWMRNHQRQFESALDITK